MKNLKNKGIFFLRTLDFKQVKIGQLSYSEQKDIIPKITESSQYSVASVAQITATKTMIIPFNQVSLLSDLKRVSNRISDVKIRRDQIEIDSINFELPKNTAVDKLPIAGSFKSDFGSYKLDVVQNGNKVCFIRTINWNKCQYKPERYVELMQYQKKVNEMDRQVIILKPV